MTTVGPNNIIETSAEETTCEEISDTEIPPAQTVELDNATLTALEAQKDKLLLPEGVAIENGTVKIAKKTPQKYIRIPKEKEQEVKDFLAKKGALKPVSVSKPIIEEEQMPNVPIQEVAVSHNQQSIKQFAYNMFHVIPQGVGSEVWITVTNPQFGPISPDQAINLAVWLVRLAMEHGATISFGELKQALDEMMDK